MTPTGGANEVANERAGDGAPGSAYFDSPRAELTVQSALTALSQTMAKSAAISERYWVPPAILDDLISTAIDEMGGYFRGVVADTIWGTLP